MCQLLSQHGPRSEWFDSRWVGRGIQDERAKAQVRNIVLVFSLLSFVYLLFLFQPPLQTKLPGCGLPSLSDKAESSTSIGLFQLFGKWLSATTLEIASSFCQTVQSGLKSHISFFTLGLERTTQQTTTCFIFLKDTWMPW